MVDHRQRHNKPKSQSNNLRATGTLLHGTSQVPSNHSFLANEKELKEDTHVKGMFYALTSGFLAASASLCGKFSMTSNEALLTCKTLLGFYYFEVAVDDNMNVKPSDHSAMMQQAEQLHHTCLHFLMTFRIIFFILMILCNAIMWTIFTKSLHLCKSTLEATVTNTAANFFFAAIYGQVLFRETLSVMWWSGTGLIIIGLLFIHSGNNASSIISVETPTFSSNKKRS